ncbi:MAG: hypothetical protein ACK4YK_16135, partial [Dolichospermum sp.]
VKMINGEILKAVKTARAVFHPLSKARKTELRSCFSGAFKLSGLSCKASFFIAVDDSNCEMIVFIVHCFVNYHAG